jgi:hypothetical protein
MASERLRRFLNLERPRRGGAEPAPQVSDRRFAQVEAPGGDPHEPAVPPEATDRFREPKERPLEVAEAREDRQPFRRCARCETDNSLYAATCQSCQADLGTDEQRIFNERLWAQRREEAARERAALADRERERERVAAEEARARRALAEEMARREGDLVRDRLGDGDFGGGWGRRGWGDGGAGRGPGSGTPYGIRLLRMIRNPAARIAVIAGTIALPILLIALSGRNSGWRVAGMVLAFVIVALVSPPGYRYRRRDWWRW